MVVGIKGMMTEWKEVLMRGAWERAQKLRAEGSFERLRREQRGTRSGSPSPEEGVGRKGRVVGKGRAV